MDNELHPLDERYIEAYGIREGNGSDDPGTGTVRCPLCGGELLPTHHQRRGHRYFKHRHEEQTARCPLTTPNYQLDRFEISLHTPDLNAVRMNRAQFLFNWKRHFRIARHMAPALTLERFIAVVKYADVMNLWGFPLLDQRDLPYVLLVLAGFIAEHRKGDVTMWTRFWFDGRVRSASDLWRSGGVRDPQLYRVVYRDVVRTPFPTGAEIVRWESVERVDRVADLASRGVGRADMRLFEKFLENDTAIEEE
ncbi:hypothetical protein [Paraburkholderia humisilvae]|uniref:hypothetical protein n=1 Tax=Paraburkholderia humisilvae TaxID=627669 RepID=UPI001581FE3C|nr:hypothetical protein [Paraburkholderia humisilvae]